MYVGKGLKKGVGRVMIVNLVATLPYSLFGNRLRINFNRRIFIMAPRLK